MSSWRILRKFYLNSQSEELFYEKSDTKGKNGNAQADGCHFKETTKELVILHHRKVEGKEGDYKKCDSISSGKSGTKNEERCHQ